MLAGEVLIKAETRKKKLISLVIVNIVRASEIDFSIVRCCRARFIWIY